MRIVAIIPAYNEESRVAGAIADAAPFVSEIIVVDDCSTDNTHQVALETGVHVLKHIINRGQGAALQTGTEYAIHHLDAEVVVHFDADGQMRGEDIPDMVAPIKYNDADIVLGSRFLGKKSNMPFTRWLMLRGALLFTVMVSGIKVTDTHNGFRALSKKAALEIKITINRMAHGSEILDLIKTKKLDFVERAVKIRYTDSTLEKGQSFKDSFVVVKDFFKSKFFDKL